MESKVQASDSDLSASTFMSACRGPECQWFSWSVARRRSVRLRRHRCSVSARALERTRPGSAGLTLTAPLRPRRRHSRRLGGMWRPRTRPMAAGSGSIGRPAHPKPGEHAGQGQAPAVAASAVVIGRLPAAIGWVGRASCARSGCRSSAIVAPGHGMSQPRRSGLRRGRSSTAVCVGVSDGVTGSTRGAAQSVHAKCRRYQYWRTMTIAPMIQKATAQPSTQAAAPAASVATPINPNPIKRHEIVDGDTMVCSRCRRPTVSDCGAWVMPNRTAETSSPMTRNWNRVPSLSRQSRTISLLRKRGTAVAELAGWLLSS